MSSTHDRDQEIHFAPYRAAGHGRGCVAAAARRDDSGADCRTEDARETRAPSGCRVSPEWRGVRELAAEGSGRRFRALACALAARAVPQSGGGHHRPRRSPGRSPRRRRRRSLTRVRIVSDRRSRQEVGQHGPEQRVDGPARGEGLRARYAALVTAADRRHEQPGGIVRHGIQLRVQQHALLADSDPAADVRERSAGRLRAAVRRERQHGSARARWLVCARIEAFSTRSPSA